MAPFPGSSGGTGKRRPPPLSGSRSNGEPRAGRARAQPAPPRRRSASPKPQARTGGRRRKPSTWERHLIAVFAGAVMLLVLAVAVWTTGSRLVDALFAPDRVSSAATEHLLLAIDQDAARRLLAPAQLADSLPVIGKVPENVRRAIRLAARATGVDSGYLVAVAARESGFDPTARAPQTSATGLYQFTDDTWLRVVKVFGARHGLAGYAREIAVVGGDEVAVPKPAVRARLLKLRTDPVLAAVMAAELALDNGARLQVLLGRRATPAEVYLAHFLGVAQAARLIETAQSAPLTPGAELLSAAARSNPGVFSPGGEAASASAIVARIAAYFTREMPRFATL